MQFSGIDELVITERKQVLANDLAQIQAKLDVLQKQVKESENLVQALVGAMQQCDNFLQQIHNESGDVGTGKSNADSSIPSNE